ncbi:hypothetical protein V6Z11_A07G183500 [Gossypium hirsutum]
MESFLFNNLTKRANINDTNKNIHDCSDSSSYYSKPHYHFNLYVYNNDANYRWNNDINNCIDSYLRSQICIDSSILSSSGNSNDNYIYNYICSEGGNSSEGKNFDIITCENGNDLTLKESSNDLDLYKHLWVQCENCYGLNYKKLFKSKMNICEQCGYHLKMSSSDGIKVFIDPDTWGPMDEDMISLNPIEFQSGEELYKDRIDFYQRNIGLTRLFKQTQFIGGSMGSVVGKKIILCASGGARLQERSLSMMQMAKISPTLYDYRSNKKLFYVSILTSPTTDGVTASFGMLEDIIIVESNAYTAFVGKKVIEQTLNKTILEGSQSAEYLFHKGLFDSIVPCNPLKGILSELDS